MIAKTDNSSLESKLMLRRYFLQRYHSGPLSVLDCCEGDGLIWHVLGREFEIAQRLGFDIKAGTGGRLRMDSRRFLRTGNWARFDVVDIDSYGSPWGHWMALLVRGAKRSLTVFLTVGLTRVCGGNMAAEMSCALGLDQLRRRVPMGLHTNTLNQLGVTYLLAEAHRYGYRYEAIAESSPSANARYVGVRLCPS